MVSPRVDIIRHLADGRGQSLEDDDGRIAAKPSSLLIIHILVALLLCSAGIAVLLGWYEESAGSALTVQRKHAASITPSSRQGATHNSAAALADVLTYHNDNARTGQNLGEKILNRTNVNAAVFGKLFTLKVDGKVDAQPLYKSSVNVPGRGLHNMLYVVTEHDSVFAFDADTGALLWHRSLLRSGETPSDNRGCDQVTPEIGITATPVIDPGSGPHGTMYLVAMSTNAVGEYFQKLHALDISTGAEEFGGPATIQAEFPGTGDNSIGGKVVFDPASYKERAALLLLNGTIYTAWASHCDIRPYTGWIIGYDANTLAQNAVVNITPNGSRGAIWASGAGPAADEAGNIYLLDGNGTFDAILNARDFPARGDFGNSFLKLSAAGLLRVADYFAPHDTLLESSADKDLGSGGALVLPDMADSSRRTRHLAVGAGKDTSIYLVDRDNLGKFHAAGDATIYQELKAALRGPEFGMPAFFDNTIYFGAYAQPIVAFRFSNARLANRPSSATHNRFVYPGSTPSISANGSREGILWAAENGGIAVLHAYDASDLSRELYNSTRAPGGRDNFGAGNKFITPTIANGKVYVGTASGVGVFGLLR